ncbi:hypothetical protein BD310DRAFT_911826 [Dichomitus squalens]|uniref:Uncharacterized protein n=1 Tax=Dichomitus squalens TaxID=114155 RepID=A0A4Q9QD27_9APHY|nr:hypothetical protein BD310DRAFT_911826 [Dichomitus squalens]
MTPVDSIPFRYRLTSSRQSRMTESGRADRQLRCCRSGVRAGCHQFRVHSRCRQ